MRRSLQNLGLPTKLVVDPIPKEKKNEAGFNYEACISCTHSNKPYQECPSPSRDFLALEGIDFDELFVVLSMKWFG